MTVERAGESSVRVLDGGAYAELRTRPGRAAAAAALKETGLIYSISGPDEVHASDDVRFSLRHSDDD